MDRRTEERRGDLGEEERLEEQAGTHRTPSGEPADAEAGEDGRNITINRIVEAASAAGVSFEEMARMIAEAAGMTEEEVRASPLSAQGRLDESDARTPLGDGNVLEARRAEEGDGEGGNDAREDETPSGEGDPV